jgi:hypothetical protein
MIEQLKYIFAANQKSKCPRDRSAPDANLPRFRSSIAKN